MGVVFTFTSLTTTNINNQPYIFSARRRMKGKRMKAAPTSFLHEGEQIIEEFFPVGIR